MNQLGALVVIEMREAVRVPRNDLIDKWMAENLHIKNLPGQRSAKDAFRKATPRGRSANGLQLEPYQGEALKSKGIDMAVVMTRVSDDTYDIAKRHDNCTAIGLDKDGKLEEFGYTWRQDESDFLEAIRTDFEQLSGSVVDGSAIRTSIKNEAQDADAFIVKGGVFMFPATTMEVGWKLVDVTKWLNQYLPPGKNPNTTMITEYADTREQRVQLKDNLSLYIRETLTSEFAALQSYIVRQKANDTKPGQRYQNSVLGTLSRLGGTIAEYEQVLGEALTDLQTFMGVQQAMFQQELDRI